MKRKTFTMLSVMILVLALACLYVGIERFMKIPSVKNYEDKGIHTFLPYRVLPTQVKNTASGRQGRMHPTKTVYYLYYKEVGGTGYKWKEEVSTRKEGEEKISEGRQVKGAYCL